jgi:hypothetical protein
VSTLAEFTLRAVAIGVGATVVMDLWAVLLQRLFRVQPSNWAMVGRWVGHFSNGKFLHDRSRMRGPYVVSWRLAGLSTTSPASRMARCYSVSGASSGRGAPRCLPALILSWVALVAPFFVLQPGMGLGCRGRQDCESESDPSTQRAQPYGLRLGTLSLCIALRSSIAAAFNSERPGPSDTPRSEQRDPFPRRLA